MTTYTLFTNHDGGLEMNLDGNRAEAIADAKEWGREVGANEVFIYKGKMSDGPMIGYVTIPGIFKLGVHPSVREYGETGHIRASTSRDPEISAVRNALSKIRVKSGLMPGFQDIGDWSLRFGYSRDESQFILTLRHKPTFRERTVVLKQEYVETRGRSMWRADNTWRLTPLGVDTMAAQIEPILARPR